MNIEAESISLLSLVLRESIESHQFIVCVLARSNEPPGIIKSDTSTEYPSFYGYSIDRIPQYLMNEGILTNIPRMGLKKSIISSHNLSSSEEVINRAKSWDLSQKLEHIGKFIVLDNNTKYSDAEAFLLFRDKAYEYVKKYVDKNGDNISGHIRSKLGRFTFGSELLKKADENSDALLRSKEKIQQSWLSGQSDWIKGKLWQVVVELKAESEITGEIEFKIPLDRFKSKNLNLDDVIKILINLENRKIISTFRDMTRRSPGSLSTSLSIGLGLKDDSNLFYDPKTTISLTHDFKYLYAVLEKDRHQDSPKEESSPYANRTIKPASLTQTASDVINSKQLPTKQQKLLRLLKKGQPVETGILRKQIPSSDLSSLKSATLKSIKNLGYEKDLTINTSRGGLFYFYKLDIPA